MNKSLLSFIFFIGIAYTQAFGQSAKRFFTDAKTAEATNNYEEAIDYYSKAILLDKNYFEAFLERGKCFEKTQKIDEAIKDYSSASVIKSDEIEPIQLAGLAFVKLKNYSEALVYFKKITSLKRKRIDALQNAAFCMLNLTSFKNAISECDKAIAIDNKSSISYLYKAMALDSLGEVKIAFENYTNSISNLENETSYKSDLNKSKYINYFIGLGNSQNSLGLFDLAITSYTKAIEMDPKSSMAFLLRGKVQASKMKMNESERDFNQSIILNSNNKEAFAGRAFVYYRIGEYEKAIGDYEKAILLDNNYYKAIKGKAECFEALNKLDEAQQLYSQAFILASKNNKSDNSNYEIALTNINKKIVEYNREQTPPTLIFNEVTNDKLQIIVPRNKLSITLNGRVKDDSKISKIMIGEVDVPFSKDEKNPTFSANINVLMKDEIEVFVQDIYGNELKAYYKIIRAEKDAPKISISYPLAISGNVFNLNDSMGYKMKLEGKIEDESSIKSIIVNGISAIYNSKDINPVFIVEFDIAGVDTLRVIAIDEFDNSSKMDFILKRGDEKNSKSNPMGKTWVVFIDNAKYSQLPMLEASSNDVLSMKTALQSYNIDNMIVKSDLTKQQMERFFAIDLRDLINFNKVNSVMIFYAGHGKFINESGYWLPIDANKKDEFTFFNVSNLKNYLSTYKSLTHSLVVSDACETGPAFYLAMRDANRLPECGQWEAANKNSAQVLSSTTIDLNDDKSVFTKLFVNALQSCTDKCISIEKIADKIAKQSVQYQKQKPKLGIIPTLNNDDDATFFFVKR